LTFDFLEVSVPIGSNIYSYGQVPELIKWCVTKLVVKNRGTLGLATSILPDPSLMLSEKTDNYTYRLSEDALRDSLSGSTGDIEVDKILDQFRPGWISIDFV